MQDARLNVELGLDERGDIDRVCGRSCRGECCTRLGDVAEFEADLALEELYLNERHFVVQTLELGQEERDQRERLGVLLVVEVAKERARRIESTPTTAGTYRATRRASSDCFRYERFSALLHSIISRHRAT